MNEQSHGGNGGDNSGELGTEERKGMKKGWNPFPPTSGNRR